MPDKSFVRRHIISFSCILFAIIAFASAAPARAQTGPELLIKPFEDGTKVELSGDGYFSTNDRIKGGSAIRLDDYQTQGRYQFLPDADGGGRIGYSLDYLDLNTNNPALPGSLIDESAGFGMGIGTFSGWLAGFAVGAGYAGNGYIPASRGYYGLADIAIGRELNATDSLGFILDYDGHRTFMPDVPIPGFIYQKQIDPTLEADVGFPYTHIQWKPTAKLTIEATVEFPNTANAKIDYALPLHFDVFGAYDASEDAYELRSLPNQRMFFQSQRFEGGLGWSPYKGMTVKVAGGYAFDQRFNTGFDDRSLHLVARIGDRPYVHVGLEWNF